MPLLMDVDGAEGETGFLYYGKIFYKDFLKISRMHKLVKN